MPWVWNVLLLGVLLIGAYFRFTGIEWDDNHHLHPDERFLTMVESSITPVKSFSEYFDTANSSLNPNNRGYNFYVYGTLPIFIVRYVGQWFGQTGYDQIHVVGRVLSGIFDLGTVLFIYLIGKKLYRNVRVGLLAALFLALSVLPIQLSHFFAVDTFATFFVYVTLYAALGVSLAKKRESNNPDETKPEPKQNKAWWLDHWRPFIPYAMFGLFFGMALASKVSVWALAFVLPLSSLVYYLNLEPEHREEEIGFILRNLVLAGIIAFLTFRFFQPYSFMGPGFFGLSLNKNWINNLKELSHISSGEVDVPYALQWARRPITFAWTNMVKWGLGLPLGLTAWAGFAWMSWRSIKGDWKKHLLIIFWVTFVFITQSLNPVRAMRYQLPIYPALGLMAAWLILKLWDSITNPVRKLTRVNIHWNKVFSVILLVVTITSSALWAFAFTRIYTRPVTRVAASVWIYGHIPAAINLQVDPKSGMQFMQPVAYQNSAYISSDNPYVYGYTPLEDATVTRFKIEHVLAQQENLTPISLLVYIREPRTNGANYKATGFYQSVFDTSSDIQGGAVEISFDFPAQLEKGKYYELVLEVAELNTILKIDGGVSLEISSPSGNRTQYFSQPVHRLTAETPFEVTFTARTDGAITKIQFGHVSDILNLDSEKTLLLSIFDPARRDEPLGYGSIKGPFTAGDDPRGETRWLELDKPAILEQGKVYILQLALEAKSGALGFYNDALVMESSWDDAIPMGMFGYGPFGYETGLYGNNRNLELYWNDNAEKLERFYETLDQSDVILITSNRQWGTTVRVPERYPLTSTYYRSLLGCPADKDILWCYEVAQPDLFVGELGFELTAVFQSDPNLGIWKINDQSAEEAFTVYDHPKVLIFQKSDTYDQKVVRQILGSVDLGTVVNLTPKQASEFKGNLFLSDETKRVQTTGGTWAELFPATSALNIYPWLALLVWYLVISLLGLIVYPLVRLVFKGLSDKGYPFARLTAILLLAYFTWLVASVGGQFSRLTIIGVISGLVLINGFLAYHQREGLLMELRTRKRYFLKVELVMLALFALMLFIRWSNPDLWHPWRGGEKPMDLSYFTAVLKSTVFPPYDPWYAGGHINYYYFGFVIAAVPTKLLGIIPAVAYNFIIPTFFALTGLGAFSIGWNLISNRKLSSESVTLEETRISERRSFYTGIISLVFTLIIGNLGSVRMIWKGFQKIAAPGGVIEDGKWFEHITWFIKGLGEYAKGINLPIGIGEWYWTPSRALPGDTITEFPFFTFTYADLHAHMIALPITILMLGWAISILYNRWNRKDIKPVRFTLEVVATLLFGGLCLGILRTTNTWDLPTYLGLIIVGITYTIFKYGEPPQRFIPQWPIWLRKAAYIALIIVFLVMVSSIFFLPFSKYYAQAYGSIDRWTGDHSPLGSYLVHWGLPLFLIVTWFIWETREWLAATPASSLNKVKPYLVYLQVLTMLFAAILILITLLGIKIGWFVGLLAVWDLILLMRPGQNDQKRAVLFMIGTALVLTLFVELFVLVGDVGRMNTVFKFYYQAWTLLSISAAAALLWLVPAVKTIWKEGILSIWQVAFGILLVGACLYPVTAATDKIRDRMSEFTPRTLDGLEFMKTSTYADMDRLMDLSQDYRAIQWIQQNIKGSPVIVEANTVEYKWGNRYTIYTGLPGVLGWNWHQRQQRGAIDHNGIADRLIEIPEFYLTEDVEIARRFIEKYDVEYIILGQLEQAYYPGNGLMKFDQFNGLYWNEVYRELDTVIYQVKR
jgi:YYY domain-containing protein